MTFRRLFNTNQELPPIVREILAEDLDALTRRLADGWDINAHIQIGRTSWHTPLAIAIVENKLRVLDFLLERHVNLHEKLQPPIQLAVQNCSAETVERLLAHGAKLNPWGSTYQCALYSERFDLLPALFRLGLALDADYGHALRSACANGQMQAVQFFVEHGINVNIRGPGPVFTNNPTAVALAAQNRDLPLVKYLVAHGADVTIEDDDGDRPYTHAIANDDEPMQTYLKALEPPEWHSEETLLKRLNHGGAPEALIALLRSEHRRMEFAEGAVRFIEFHHLLNVRTIKWKRHQVLDLLKLVDNYGPGGYLVWSPRHAKLAHLNLEHDRLKPLCKWETFVASPGKWINRIASPWIHQ